MTVKYLFRAILSFYKIIEVTDFQFTLQHFQHSNIFDYYNKQSYYCYCLPIFTYFMIVLVIPPTLSGLLEQGMNRYMQEAPQQTFVD